MIYSYQAGKEHGKVSALTPFEAARKILGEGKNGAQYVRGDVYTQPWQYIKLIGVNDDGAGIYKELKLWEGEDVAYHSAKNRSKKNPRRRARLKPKRAYISKAVFREAYETGIPTATILRAHAKAMRPVIGKARMMPKRKNKKSTWKPGAMWSEVTYPQYAAPKRNSTSKGIDCIVLRGATTGKVYARLLNSTTTMADMKAMARAIAARYKEAVTATRTKVTP